ncbi:low-density lipoprotein receptor-related protein 4-like [Acanthaster planci]|uniref:Low-density lipoprotein receptor-related protein 4-like n=1 Tax=Acanthaster planci TaxID=133434 RepID=A0A8B7YJU4_ACAPL|nr:low-density lipoprotein receptor-related protein 4-like [Acanthaster planci]
MNSNSVCSFYLLFLAANANGYNTSTDFVLVADRVNAAIFIGDLGDFDLSPLPLGNLSAPIAVDYDPVDGMVYWTDFVDTTILRAHLDGSRREILIWSGLVEPNGLALDYHTRLMFWTDGRRGNKIERASMDGGDRRVIVSQHLKKPRAIAVDQKERHIYWSSWGNRAKIERADYNGNHRMVLVDASIIWPNGIALDLTGGLLYWGDAQRNTLERSDLSGNNRRTLFNFTGIYPFDLAVHGDTLYWTDWNSDFVLKLNMTQMEVYAAGSHIFSRATGIHVHCTQGSPINAGTDHINTNDPTPLAFSESTASLPTTIAPVVENGIDAWDGISHRSAGAVHLANIFPMVVIQVLLVSI